MVYSGDPVGTEASTANIATSAAETKQLKIWDGTDCISDPAELNEPWVSDDQTNWYKYDYATESWDVASATACPCTELSNGFGLQVMT